MDGTKAKYAILRQNSKAVAIEDLSTGRSVTNDAEAVVRELHQSGILAGRRLIYFDTFGQLDELKHDGKGNFTGFAPGPCDMPV
jgi:hypothetical protein